MSLAITANIGVIKSVALWGVIILLVWLCLDIVGFADPNPNNRTNRTNN